MGLVTENIASLNNKSLKDFTDVINESLDLLSKAFEYFQSYVAVVAQSYLIEWKLHMQSPTKPRKKAPQNIQEGSRNYQFPSIAYWFLIEIAMF